MKPWQAHRNAAFSSLVVPYLITRAAGLTPFPLPLFGPLACMSVITLIGINTFDKADR
jgi:hypothetical protein